MNLPGILSIDFYKASTALSPYLKNGDTVNISEITSEISTSLQFIPDSCSMNVKTKQSNHGSLFNISIPFKIEGNASSSYILLDQLNRIPHIYVVTDKNNIKYLLGSKDLELAFVDYDSKNDASPKGGRSITAQINVSSFRFPIYVE